LQVDLGRKAFWACSIPAYYDQNKLYLMIPLTKDDEHYKINGNPMGRLYLHTH
jgi:hypothetical protein